MPATILFNKSTTTMPPLAFSTPVSSPGLAQLRRRNRAANGPPLLLKRKRTPPSAEVTDASYLPTHSNLPFLDCGNFGNGRECLSLPKIILQPRKKRSRIGCFLSSSPQEQDCHNRSNSETETRKGTHFAPIEEKDDGDTITAADADTSNQLRRSSSSKSMLFAARRPSMNLTRSLSLQVNLSLLNLATATTNSSDCCPLSSSTSSTMPKRKSLLQLTSPSSAKDIQNQDSNLRRSPVATTLDYLATAIRISDVGIGLSI